MLVVVFEYMLVLNTGAVFVCFVSNVMLDATASKPRAWECYALINPFIHYWNVS